MKTLREKKPSKFFYLLAILSLLFILTAIGGGILKKNAKLVKDITSGIILGITDESSVAGKKEEIKSAFEEKFESTKEMATEKMIEVEKNVAATLEKEITDFTSAQVKSIKTRICTDWGIISPPPIDE